jgi:hypothetical protein
MKYLVFILIFFSFSCRYERRSYNLSYMAQQNSNDIDSLITVLKSSKCVEEHRIGITMVRSYTYMAAEELWQQSSVKQLTKLCSNKNANVRCYAFLGLISSYNERKLVEKIAEKHKNDGERVVRRGGCIQWPCTVSQYMEMQLRNFYSGDTIYRRLK